MADIVTLYRGLTHLAGPLVHRLLQRRLAAGKEDPQRLPERLGHAGRPRPAGPLIWLHAASVGESMAVLPLVARLVALPGRPHVLVTTGTVTSAALMAERLPPGAFHQYVPVDLPAAVRRFLDHWRPDMAVWVESEFWPNLLTALRRRAIPAVLINARLSQSSYRNWKRVPGTARRLLSCFRLALAQTAVEADRLRDLGVTDVRAVGNLKYSTDPLPADPAALATLRTAIGDRPCWVMASTHPGEEALAAAVHHQLAPRLPGLLTIIVPRHPRRGADIAHALQADGLTVRRRAGGDDGRLPPRLPIVPPATHTPAVHDGVYIADTLGELGLFFRLAPVAVIGGSFAPIGGHNPIEAAQLGAAVIFGPHMQNFAEIATALQQAGGALQVIDSTLAVAVEQLLRDPDARARQARIGQEVAAANRSAIDRVMTALTPILAAIGLAPETPPVPPSASLKDTAP